MCMLSTTGDHCQPNGFYCKLGDNNYPCLPHWKFNDQVTAVIETGAAPDGDEDSILGMILLLYCTRLSPHLCTKGMVQVSGVKVSGRFHLECYHLSMV